MRKKELTDNRYEEQKKQLILIVHDKLTHNIIMEMVDHRGGIEDEGPII